jgi:hypothetical protein
MKNATTITRRANTLYAPYLPHAAYKALVQLAKDHNGEIVTNDDHTTRVDFADATTAKNVLAKWTADYEALRKPTPTPTHEAKPVPAKGKAKTVVVTDENGNKYTVKATDLAPVEAHAPKKASPRKSTKTPARTKCNAFDFGKIKGKTNTDKNRALHAMLVSMGIKDSRTPEYMSVWNARPWAN